MNLNFDASKAKVMFECTRLKGTDKKGIMRPNEDGTYSHVVGALNVHNFHGDYYPYEEAKRLFEDSSSLIRQVNRGVLRGEWGHPNLRNIPRNQFDARLLFIDPDKICCTHRRIWLDFTSVLDDNGNPIIAILSDVAPFGPYGPALKQALDSEEQSTFSVRAFADLFPYRNGRTRRVLNKIVTFDWENEPGIEYAEKFRSPALEGLNTLAEKHFQVDVTPEILREAIESQQLLNGNAVTESIGSPNDFVSEVFINYDNIQKTRKSVINW